MDSLVSSPQPVVADRRDVELVLFWQGREIRLPARSEQRLTIGLQRDNVITIRGTYASRHHATLHWRRKAFELIDHSTNGTYVQLEDGQINHVHRLGVRLWGAGFLSFGEPLTATNALKFRHA